MVRRPPCAELASGIAGYWQSEGAAGNGTRERALPTGAMTLVLNLGSEPIRLFRDESDLVGRTFATSVVWGPQSSYVIRDTSRRGSVVGVQFHAGRAGAVLGVRADQLTDSHCALEELWGDGAVLRLRQQVADARGAKSGGLNAFDILDRELAARGRRTRPLLMHPGIAHAVRALCAAPAAQRIGELQRESGCGSRRFIKLFESAVGLTPKRFLRIRRLGGAVQHAVRGEAMNWAAVAADCGYYDQAHLNRDFREFAGITPGQYVATAPERPLHVRVA